jgi:hypothetical protein
VWGAVRTVISASWNAIHGIWQGIINFLANPLRAAFNGFRTVVETVWGAVRGVISRVWDDGIRPVFAKLREWMGGNGFIADAFRAAVAAIRTVWDSLKEIARKPVHFIVHTVYNDGIRKVVNAIPGAPNLPVLKFAAGGPVFGGLKGMDSVPALLMPGEHVLTTAEVKALGGHDAVLRFRQAIRDGEFSKVGDFGFPRFAEGGGLTAAAISRAQSFARSQVGKPYLCGGVGPGGYDCSGFMSAITNVLRGRSPHSRLGSTATFPWSGFQSGFGQFTIGSFRGNPGHMAGTLAGLNVESAGGVGVRVGSSARGAGSSMFTTRAHLGAGGDFGGGGGDGGGLGIDTGFLKIIKDILSKVGGWLSTLKNMNEWGSLMTGAVREAIDGFKSWVAGKIGDVLGVVGDVKDGVTSLLKGAGDGLASFVGGLFDKGGILRNGALAFNGSGKPERVLDPRTTENFEVLVRTMNYLARGGVGRGSYAATSTFGVGGTGNTHEGIRDITIQITAPDSSPHQVARATALAIRMAL